jgi:hypothetical protein
MTATIFSLVISLGFLGILLRSMQRQHLRERTALLWLTVGLAMVLFSATLPLHLLNGAAKLVGIAYPPELILLLAILFLVVLVFHLSVGLARLSERQTRLVQELGILTANPGAVQMAGTHALIADEDTAGPN